MKGTWVNELIMLYRENPGFPDIVLLAIYSGSAVDPRLQLPMQSVPITTDVVGSTPAQGECTTSCDEAGQ